MDLPALPGTVAIFDGIGELDRHPVVRVRTVDGGVIERPDLFVADLVLGLKEGEKRHCLHWTVKSDSAGFLRPLSDRNVAAGRQSAQDKFDLRMRIDRLYFGAADIPTRDVAGDSIDRNVVANFMRMFSWSIQPTPDAKTVSLLRDLICSTDLSSTTPHQLSIYVWGRLAVDQDTFKRVLYGLVWDRTLRVDLFSSLMFDQPWPAERHDVLDVYSSLFAR